VKVGHPDIVCDSIAADIIAAILEWEKTDMVEALKRAASA